MRYLFVCCCALLFGMGCGQPERDSQVQTLKVLKEQFEDDDVPRATRLEAGVSLAAHKAGQDFLVAQYGSGQRVLVQAVIEQIHTTQPHLAAHVLAKLMAATGGEAKLNFEAQLIKMGDQAVNALVALAESETDWQTLMRALDALGKIQAVQGVDVMRAHLHHRNDWVRMAAAHALGDVGGEVVVPALVDALADTSDTVVSAALVGLGKTGAKRAVKACAKQLGHENPRVRAAAVSALGRLGGVEVQALLEPMIHDADSGVRFKAKQALEQFK